MSLQPPKAGIKAFGPTAAAARLEGSKGFTKDLCDAAGIPQASYRRFADRAAALAHLAAIPVPVAIQHSCRSSTPLGCPVVPEV